MAESWESSLLYYAAVADSAYMMPSQLNVAVPELDEEHRGADLCDAFGRLAGVVAFDAAGG